MIRRVIPPAYLITFPNLFMRVETLPIPRPRPIMAAANGRPNPNAKVISISIPQSMLPFIKEAARTIGKIGLQHMLSAEDKPPTNKPKIMAEIIPPLFSLRLREMPGILKGNNPMVYNPKMMEIKPAATFQYRPREAFMRCPAYPMMPPIIAKDTTVPIRKKRLLNMTCRDFDVAPTVPV